MKRTCLPMALALVFITALAVGQVMTYPGGPSLTCYKAGLGRAMLIENVYNPQPGIPRAVLRVVFGPQGSVIHLDDPSGPASPELPPRKLAVWTGGLVIETAEESEVAGIERQPGKMQTLTNGSLWIAQYPLKPDGTPDLDKPRFIVVTATEDTVIEAGVLRPGFVPHPIEVPVVTDEAN